MRAPLSLISRRRRRRCSTRCRSGSPCVAGHSAPAGHARRAAGAQRVCGLVLVGSTPSFLQRADWPTAQPPALLDSFSAGVQRSRSRPCSVSSPVLSQGDRQARAITRAPRRPARSAPARPATALRAAWTGCAKSICGPAADIATRSLLIHGDRGPAEPGRGGNLPGDSWPTRNWIFSTAPGTPPSWPTRIASRDCWTTSVMPLLPTR
jgi:hypothetical protein